MNSHDTLKKILNKMSDQIFPVLPIDFKSPHITILDLTENNQGLKNIDPHDTHKLTAYTQQLMRETGSQIAIGRYNEVRTLYSKSDLFKSDLGLRCVHLGIDIMIDTGTPVFAPLPARVHSFKNNAHYGDYGPTIILEHNIVGLVFFTLYGHLSPDSLQNIFDGMPVTFGQQLAKIGNSPDNGDWPPHLHFQIIMDMRGQRGDFPGVCTLKERDAYLALCPDPNLILGIEALKKIKL